MDVEGLTKAEKKAINAANRKEKLAAYRARRKELGPDIYEKSFRNAVIDARKSLLIDKDLIGQKLAQLRLKKKEISDDIRQISASRKAANIKFAQAKHSATIARKLNRFQDAQKILLEAGKLTKEDYDLAIDRKGAAIDRAIARRSELRGTKRAQRLEALYTAGVTRKVLRTPLTSSEKEVRRLKSKIAAQQKPAQRRQELASAYAQLGFKPRKARKVREGPLVRRTMDERLQELEKKRFI